MKIMPKTLKNPILTRLRNEIPYLLPGSKVLYCDYKSHPLSLFWINELSPQTLTLQAF
jgi:hypothetical protein